MAFATAPSEPPEDLKGDIGASLYYEQQDTRLWGIAAATCNMTEMHAHFSEVYQMDGTFKTNRHAYILYNVASTDNHGQPHVNRRLPPNCSICDRHMTEDKRNIDRP